VPVPDICPSCGETDGSCITLTPLLDRPEAVVGCFAHLWFDVRNREPYTSREEWLAALEEFAPTADGEPVKATETLRTLELRETGQTMAMPDGPVEYTGCEHFALNIHEYLGPVALCPDCMQPLGKHIFAAGAGYCWQHFSQQYNLIDCPNLCEFPREADVLKIEPSSKAWAAVKDRFPLFPTEDEE
jgi:hypothetical protein